MALGYVDDNELPALYRGAEAFVYPSLFEGFGIPIVEAMACATPAVVSSHPSMDEASGDAAVRVDPGAPKSIAAGIGRALAQRAGARAARARTRSAVHVASLRRGDVARVRERPGLSAAAGWASLVELTSAGRGSRPSEPCHTAAA